ncbi:hypothetical protein HKX68_11600 [Dickeya dadantii]|nr:hypothetical protein [Dickeya dadantii]NPE63563.1 hypothetical protein [Dickeya dadantii]
MFDHSTAEQHVDDEVATLLLFVPIKYPKSGRLNEKKIKGVGRKTKNCIVENYFF